MVAIFIKSTSMHEKPEMAHVMEDGSAARFKFSFINSDSVEQLLHMH
jgi:hypothetical protein